MDNFSQNFLAAVPKLRQEILTAFGAQRSKAGFRSVWEHFEEITNPILINYLHQGPLSIPLSDIKETESKSTYPDLKIRFQKMSYAIDVKSGEDLRDPWYDIGRLDTYEEKHLNTYAGEFCVVVKWRGRKPTEVMDVFIEPTFQTVGFRQESSGVLYRPYDGKLRPKPWAYFENGKAFWHDLDHFRQGLAASRNFRRKSHILAWYEKMNSAQRLAIRKDLNAMDEGQRVAFDKDAAKSDEDGSDA